MVLPRGAPGWMGKAFRPLMTIGDVTVRGTVLNVAGLVEAGLLLIDCGDIEGCNSLTLCCCGITTFGAMVLGVAVAFVRFTIMVFICPRVVFLSGSSGE